ncbi:hypothetical protein VE02_00186 [Pseudogymnoascus sp. 03VT05]|nr:hypothetical protein VE02_00186 [Pseudogymnoascus sp. 03VT05]
MSSVATKRSFPSDANDDNDAHHPPKRVHAMTFAAKLNAKTLRQLQEAFKANPEVDFTKPLPKNYSSRLASRLADQGRVGRAYAYAASNKSCKHRPSSTRISKTPLHTSAELWDFQYSDAPIGSTTYLEFLRRLTSPFIARDCVFTHGDLRPANIMVQPDADGSYQVTGIIDWEMSGFYPEHFECTKVTNTLATNEINDWFLHLPSCVSQARFAERWLSDFAWDKQVV